MTRLLAFALLAAAAFDLPAPWLDRLGLAALGLACFVLAFGAAFPRVRRARPFPIPAKRVALPEQPEQPVADLVARIRGASDAELVT